jgi:hypothetical protein
MAVLTMDDPTPITAEGPRHFCCQDDPERRPRLIGLAVANAILELASQLDLMGLALIFKLGAMPYDMVERSMTAFGEDVVPRIRPVLDRDATANFAATTPALHFA